MCRACASCLSDSLIASCASVLLIASCASCYVVLIHWKRGEEKRRRSEHGRSFKTRTQHLRRVVGITPTNTNQQVKLYLLVVILQNLLTFTKQITHVQTPATDAHLWVCVKLNEFEQLTTNECNVPPKTFVGWLPCLWCLLFWHYRLCILIIFGIIGFEQIPASKGKPTSWFMGAIKESKQVEPLS